MYKQNPELVSLMEPVVTAMGYELWGVEYLPRGRSSLLRIFIDNETGITLDDCARVSEQLAGVLDVHDPIRGQYELEVSSPGFDRSLFTLEQIARYQGRQARLRLKAGLDGRKNFTGVIEAVNEDTVRIIDSGIVYSIPADDIERANLKE